jgi:hypothetical protein
MSREVVLRGHAMALVVHEFESSDMCRYFQHRILKRSGHLDSVVVVMYRCIAHCHDHQRITIFTCRWICRACCSVIMPVIMLVHGHAVRFAMQHACRAQPSILLYISQKAQLGAVFCAGRQHLNLNCESFEHNLHFAKLWEGSENVFKCSLGIS